MATETSSRPDKAKAEGASSRPDLTVLKGKYAFRFSGYAMPTHIAHFLTGLGQFEIDKSGNLSGTHRAAYLALQGLDAKLQTSMYKLQGKVRMDQAEGPTAEIFFKRMSGTTVGSDLNGKFFVLLVPSENRLWFMSSAAEIPGHGRAEELVNLEAVRISS